LATISGTEKWTDIRKNLKKVKGKRHKEKERNKDAFSNSTKSGPTTLVIRVIIPGS
jgi:hypothetical protein